MRCSRRHWTAPICLFAMACICPPATFGSFIDDFEDGDATDGSPVTWVPSSLYPGGTREVVDGDYVLGHNGLASSVVEDSGELTDVSIRTQVRIVASSGSWVFPAVFARGGGGHSYWGGIRSDGLLALGEDYVTHLEVATSLNPTLSDVLLQFDVIGDQMSLTGWQDGTPKPEVPQLTITDDTLTEGSVGLFLNTDQNHRIAYRYFEVVPEPSPLALAVVAGLVLGTTAGRRPGKRART